MKKSIIIWTLAAILAVAAFYTIKNYNEASSAAKNAPRQNQQEAQAAPTPTPIPWKTDSINQSESQQPQDRINMMEKYDFTLEDLDGNKITLSELKGKKIFLNFWATWCPPCKAEMPDIEKLYKETKDSGIIILAVNVGEDKKTVQDFIVKNNYSFTVLLDAAGEVSQLYQVTGIPTSYFIDTEGYLYDGVTGAMPLESMKEYVNKLK